MTNPGRNAPCPCGSGKKYKHCCQAKDAAQAAKARAARAFIPGTLQMAIGQHQAGRLSTAKALYQQILQAEPRHPDALQLLGLSEHQQGNSAKAIELIEQAIQVRPNDAIFRFNLGNLHDELGQLDEAIAYFKQALQHQPGFVDALLGLGTALGATGRVDEAIATYRKALLLQPDYVVAYNNLLFVLQCSVTCPPAEIFAEHLRYAERFEVPLKHFWQSHRNSREPGRRLKVGYVSGDFHRHSVAYFIEPILACHDKSQVELFGYYNNTRQDTHTARIAAHMDRWLACSALSDEQLAERIRADGIDILVDLSGHTSKNRLLVFARKPAPVQATYIGYPDTTGLSAMDYRITDAWLDPPGMTERFHSETLMRIPGGMAFRPDPEATAVNALPALTSGEFVFASFNNLRKVNTAVIKLWARVLHAVPSARLMIGNVTDNSNKERLHGLFSHAGVGPDRLILQPKLSDTDYLAMHHRIDIALDPFPYNGTTTTMQTLWMGVPVITLAGSNAKSRCGVSLMSRVDLPEFIAQSEDEYVQCALKFANDLPALNEVRQSLRQRMNAPECQPATITRQLEAAYRSMWRTWCNS